MSSSDDERRSRTEHKTSSREAEIARDGATCRATARRQVYMRVYIAAILADVRPRNAGGHPLRNEDN